MDHNQITNGNRRIKELMGSTIKIDQDDVKDIPLAFLKVPDLKFHLSWKWLMPVVLKIEEEGHTVRIEGNSCSVDAEGGETYEASAETKMEAVWTAIVKFLEAEM